MSSTSLIVRATGIAVLASALLLSGGSPLRAQDSSLEPGMALRVHALGTELEGRLVRLDADTLVLWTGPAGSTAAAATDRSFAISDLTRLDRGVPRSSWRGAGRGTLWGVLIGGLAGAGIGAAQDTDCFLCPESRTEGALIGSVLLGGAGAAVGALVGAAWPGTRWESVPLPRPAVAAAPQPGHDR